MIDEIREVLVDYMPHNTVEDTISDIEDYGTYRENIGRDLGKAEVIDELSKEIHYCLHCGMGKDKSLEHLMHLAEKLKEQQ